MQEVERLEAALSAGKSSALTAIDRLKSNASELRQEAAWLRRQDQEEFDSKLAALTDEVSAGFCKGLRVTGRDTWRWFAC